MPHSLEDWPQWPAALGNSLRAARIWGAAERLREEIGSPLPPNDGPATTGAWPRPARRLGDDAAFDRAWQEGRALTLEQAIELTLEETTGSHYRVAPAPGETASMSES